LASLLQVVPQLVPLQAYPPHDIVVGEAHMPKPSHVGGSCATPLLQLPAPHTVLVLA